MIINPDDCGEYNCLRLLMGSVLPRPIAWTSTMSTGGVRNLAPFSFFTVASRYPPMLCISIGLHQTERGRLKDTHQNILETGEFVVNVVSLPLANAMHESSKEHPAEADEFELAGLTAAPCEVVAAPRIEEAGVSMECTLEQVMPLGIDFLVIGRVVRFHVRDELYKAGRIDTVGLQPIARLAGPYTKVDTVFDLPVGADFLEGKNPPVPAHVGSSRLQRTAQAADCRVAGSMGTLRESLADRAADKEARG